MNPIQIEVEQLHRHYCEKLQQPVHLRYHWQRLWMEWIKAGFSLDDLRLVLRYLMREYRAGRRNPGALKLSNLLQIDRFEEDLILARMERQGGDRRTAPVDTPKQSEIEEPTEEERRQGAELLRAWRIQAARRSVHHDWPSQS